jgi:hypothetical protein
MLSFNFMRRSKTLRFFICFAGIHALCSSLAHAAAITNLSEEPRQIEMRSGSGYILYTIKAQETWRVPGKATIRYQNSEFRIDENEEYAIWRDGVLGPQKRVNARNSPGIIR